MPAASTASALPRATVSFEEVRHFLLTRRAARLQQIADHFGVGAGTKGDGCGFKRGQVFCLLAKQSKYDVSFEIE